MAHGVPGTWIPPTSFTTAIGQVLRSLVAVERRGVSARRTRLSSNGFFSWFIATSCTQFQGLSCTVILLPSAGTRLSRSAGLKPRNWMWARSPRMAATWADEA